MGPLKNPCAYTFCRARAFLFRFGGFWINTPEGGGLVG